MQSRKEETALCTTHKAGRSRLPPLSGKRGGGFRFRRDDSPFVPYVAFVRRTLRFAIIGWLKRKETKCDGGTDE